MNKIILCSGSPRRKKIFDMLNINYEIIVPDTKELVNPEWTPVDTVRKISAQKLNYVIESNNRNNTLFAAFDTIVVLNNKIINKPNNIDDARKYLNMLSQNTHQVYTGIATAFDKNTIITDYEISYVSFKELSENEIDLYINTGEPFDKAGAYGIQGYGSIFIEKIEGDFYNIMGLPIFKFNNLLAKYNLSLFDFIIT